MMESNEQETENSTCISVPPRPASRSSRSAQHQLEHESRPSSDSEQHQQNDEPTVDAASNMKAASGVTSSRRPRASHRFGRRVELFFNRRSVESRSKKRSTMISTMSSRQQLRLPTRMSQIFDTHKENNTPVSTGGSKGIDADQTHGPPASKLNQAASPGLFIRLAHRAKSWSDIQGSARKCGREKFPQEDPVSQPPATSVHLDAVLPPSQPEKSLKKKPSLRDRLLARTTAIAADFVRSPPQKTLRPTSVYVPTHAAADLLTLCRTPSPCNWSDITATALETKQNPRAPSNHGQPFIPAINHRRYSSQPVMQTVEEDESRESLARKTSLPDAGRPAAMLLEADQPLVEGVTTAPLSRPISRGRRTFAHFCKLVTEPRRPPSDVPGEASKSPILNSAPVDLHIPLPPVPLPTTPSKLTRLNPTDSRSSSPGTSSLLFPAYENAPSTRTRVDANADSSECTRAPTDYEVFIARARAHDLAQRERVWGAYHAAARVPAEARFPSGGFLFPFPAATAAGAHVTPNPHHQFATFGLLNTSSMGTASLMGPGRRGSLLFVSRRASITGTGLAENGSKLRTINPNRAGEDDWQRTTREKARKQSHRQTWEPGHLNVEKDGAFGMPSYVGPFAYSVDKTFADEIGYTNHGDGPSRNGLQNLGLGKRISHYIRPAIKIESVCEGDRPPTPIL